MAIFNSYVKLPEGTMLNPFVPCSSSINVSPSTKWAIHLSQVNQIGSISEAIEACKMCQDRGWGVTWHHSREHTQRSQQYFMFFWNTFGIFNIYINVFHRGLKTVLSAPSLVGFRVLSSWNLEMDWLAKHTCSWLVVVVKHVENILYFWYSFLTHIFSSWRHQPE